MLSLTLIGSGDMEVMQKMRKMEKEWKALSNEVVTATICLTTMLLRSKVTFCEFIFVLFFVKLAMQM